MQISGVSGSILGANQQVNVHSAYVSKEWETGGKDCVIHEKRPFFEKIWKSDALFSEKQSING